MSYIHRRKLPKDRCKVQLKTKYRTQAEAEKYIKYAEEEFDAPKLHSYLCPHCNKWHVARVEREPRRYRIRFINEKNWGSEPPSSGDV